MQNPTNILGNITTVASQGEGIIRFDGWVIFIPFTAVGDIIRYRIVREKKNYAVGELVEIVEPSPLRITPQCPHYGRCGGCQLQHVLYQAQLVWKRQWVADALAKIGQMKSLDVFPVVPADKQWEYRRKIQLILRVRDKQSYRAGYVGVDHETLISVEQCPIFAGTSLLKEIQKGIEALVPATSHEGRLTILESGVLHFHFRKLPKNLKTVYEQMSKNNPALTGLLATSPQHTLQLGSVDMTCSIDGGVKGYLPLIVRFSSSTFMQGHPEQSVKLYQAIIAAVREYAPKRVLDLYCGVGIISCLLAQLQIDVVGVEINPHSIECAEQNSMENGLSTAHFVASSVEEFLKKGQEADLVIINPPREGLSSAVIDALCSYAPERLIYISCMPATLARDLKRLAERGYIIDKVQPFDLFPQTIHVETLVCMSLSTQ